MRRLLTYVGFLLALGFLAGQARAFSLNGPLADWQTPRLGYNVNVGYVGGFGVMNINEEYRWNVPTIYYAYTSDFLGYFGETGIREIEKTIKILNDLPKASNINIDDYPLRSQRQNHRALALGMLDLKSFTLSGLVGHMGLTDPTRYVYTLRRRWIPAAGNPTNYFVIQRNFDPVTLRHSSVINGDIYTYTTILDGAVNSLVIAEPLDPMALVGLINAPVASTIGTFGNTGLTLGGFWTGLTRDDVGGLKYLYKTSNYNNENIPPASTGGGGGPWSIPGTNEVQDVALRGGVEKINFVRLNYDSLTGGFFQPFTNDYSETIYINGQGIKQHVQRPVNIPDILFDADDVTGPDVTDAFSLPASQFSILVWDNNNDINGSPATANAGPGTVAVSFPSDPPTPSLVITFNTVGPVIFNTWPAFLSEFNNLGFSFIWGSFDGTTNAPFVYPDGTDIRLLEQEFFSRPWLPAQPPTNLTNGPPANGVGDPTPPEPPTPPEN